MKLKIRTAMVAAAALSTGALLSTAQAALVTYRFAGTFNQSNTLVSAGDTFSGEFTFEDSVTPSVHSGSTIDTQAYVIRDTLPGTGGHINIDSSVVADFSFTLNYGTIGIGNNNDPWGDRYIVTLSTSDPLPSNLSLNFFQLDLQDHTAYGEDMITEDHYSTLPNLALANYAGGRFFTDDPIYSQLPVTATSFEAIPEPSSIMLMGVAGGFAVFIRRRFKR